MIVIKENGVYRGFGRGYGKPDIIIACGKERWDIYEIHENDSQVLVASNLSFAEARVWDSDGYIAPKPRPTSRKTRARDGLHEFGPFKIEKVSGLWRVFCDNEIGHGLTFHQARRLAGIEKKKKQFATLRLAMSFVPFDCRNMNLHRILGRNSKIWRKLRNDVYGDTNGKCEICSTSSPRLECHEVWQYDDFRNIQKLERLIAICFLCHRAIHFNNSYLWMENNAYENVVSHYMEVNQIDRKTMIEHEEAANWIYNARGEAGAWTVDFGEWTRLVEDAKHKEL